MRILDPAKSQVIYFELNERGAVRWFVVENDRPRELLFQVGVPMGAVQSPFDPVVILFGPGLDPGGDEDLKSGVALPQGESAGMLELGRADVPERFYEPVTGTESLIVIDAQVELPMAGEYYGAVFDVQGDEGKVWVAVGRREGFSWRDIGRLPGWIQRVRAFHEVPGWPRWVWVAGAGVVAAVAALLSWAMIRRRKKA